MEYFYIKGISLIAVCEADGYLYPSRGQQWGERFDAERSCEHVLSLMQEGRLEPKRLITHRFAYTEMTKAYEMAYRRKKEMLGVIFSGRTCREHETE